MGRADLKEDVTMTQALHTLTGQICYLSVSPENPQTTDVVCSPPRLAVPLGAWLKQF